MIPVGATWHRGLDLVAIDRALSGVPPLPVLSEAEQRHAVATGTQRGLSTEVLAKRLRLVPRTVTRWRGELELSNDRP